MDHVARFAIHDETNVCTRRRFRIGVLWKHCCLHNTLLKPHMIETSRVLRNLDGSIRLLAGGELSAHAG